MFSLSRAALRSLDDLDLSEIFQRRAVVMKTVPHFLRGPFRNAMKVVLEEIMTSRDRNGRGRRSCCCPGCFSTEDVGADRLEGRN